MKKKLTIFVGKELGYIINNPEVQPYPMEIQNYLDAKAFINYIEAVFIQNALVGTPLRVDFESMEKISRLRREIYFASSRIEVHVNIGGNGTTWIDLEFDFYGREGGRQVKFLNFHATVVNCNIRIIRAHYL